LKTIVRHPNIKPEIDRIILEAVLDRRQFVSAFVRAFKPFLETDYLAFLHSGENKFDLRSAQPAARQTNFMKWSAAAYGGNRIFRAEEIYQALAGRLCADR